MGARRWGRRPATDRDEADLRAEVERLTQEVVRLRLERQRPVGLGAVAQQLQELGTGPGAAALEQQDEAHHVLAQAESMRQSLLDVLDQLVVAASQMQRQLLAGTSVMEIDRRVLDRRRRGGERDGAERGDAERGDVQRGDVQEHVQQQERSVALAAGLGARRDAGAERVAG